MLDATETANSRFGKYMMWWWGWLRKAVLTISFELLSIIGSKRMATIMDDTTTTGCCRRISFELFFSVKDNHSSNSSWYNLFIFVSFFFSPTLFSWLLALISFYYFSSACNVITLTIFLSFYVSLKHTFFFTLSGCAYHWSSTITRFRG